MINILALAGSLFMLQVYDRVLPSRSLPTLVALVVLVVALYGFQSALEGVRGRLFARVGRRVDQRLAPLAFSAHLRGGVPGAERVGSALRDTEQLRGFLAGGGPSALFDLPWAPLFVGVLFLLHPSLGALGLVAIAVLTALTALTESGTRPHQASAAADAIGAATLAEAARRQAETILPLGMALPLQAAWRERYAAAGSAVLAGSDVAGRLSAISRFFRLSLQSGVLAWGAFLVMRGDASGGVMVASSIILGRALAPVELAIANWRGFVAAREAFGRLDVELVAVDAHAGRMILPPPARDLVVERATVATPGAGAPFLREVTFSLQAGDALAVIGPSGAGKSTLARALVGVWPLQRGAVRFDGSTLDQWPAEDVGRFLGYLPQTVELFDGTIGQNIARFRSGAASDEVLKAARAAGIEGYIRSLPEGFDTRVGEAGQRLSAGQRQRVALARALFGDPFLLVLDEPNSALDAEGEAALTRVVQGVRDRGGVVIIVAHRPGALHAANKALVLAGGAQRSFGPRDDVLRQVLAPVPRAAEPVHAEVAS